MENDVVIPLNPQTTVPQVYKASDKKQQKTKLKVKPKGPVMSFMDTLLTLLIVSPLIVGQWRGTWTLMDVYERTFPSWESFLFGCTLHLSFAIMREGLQDLINFKANSWWRELIIYILRRMYTYFFAFACIMNWRGGWLIFDEWLGLELLPDGRTAPGENVPMALAVFGVCLVLMGILRSCRNVLAAPFVIGLDTKTTAFDFPTRYRISICYTTVYAVNSNRAAEDNNTKRKLGPSASKLIANAGSGTPSQVTIEKQVVEHISPRPFLNDLRGASPSGFSPSFAFTTTTTYPQILNHRIPSQPHNIQDIIQYLSANAHKQKELSREEHRALRDKFKWHGTKQRHRFSRPHLPQDPFFAYKPQDPSDINLLAPTSFRFAPSSLSPGFNTNKHRQQQQFLQEAENVVSDTEIEGYNKRPLSLTLNVYPSPFENDFGNGDNRFKFHGPGVTPRYRYPSFLGRLPTGINRYPNRMILHLNLYPGAGGGNSVLSDFVSGDEEEEDVERKFSSSSKRN